MPSNNKNQRLLELEKDAERFITKAAKKGLTADDVSTYTYFVNKKARQSAVVGSREVK